jgi:AhpD family alkylhydroperoxidase
MEPIMSVFSVPTYESVSVANQALFDNLKKGLGMMPNLYATFAYSETALGTYLTLQSAKSSISAKEREVVNLVVSQVNECAYCLAAHTVIGKMNGFSDEHILDIRQGRAPFDPKLEALAKFVKKTAQDRGHTDTATTDALFEAGYTKGQLVDIIVTIGDKIITNYLHGVTKVPVDFPTAPDLSVEA